MEFQFENSESLNPVMVEYYERIGYLPEAVLNALSRLGWSLDDKTEILPLDTVVTHFTLDRVVKNPAGLDPDKLFAFQSHWMTQLPLDEKVRRCGEHLRDAGLIADPADPATRAKVAAVVEALGERLKLSTDVLDCDFFFTDSIAYDEKNFAKRVAKDGTPDLLDRFTRERLAPLGEADWTVARLEAELNAFSEANGVPTGTLIHALRLSVTGQAVGPGVFDCLAIVGKAKSLARIDAALAKARPATA